MPYQIIVCGGLAPDPLQTLEPVTTPTGPGLKNELMLPAVFDPWAGHALYEAANLAKSFPGSVIKVVSIAPKAKLQQVMMTVAQKLPFELVPIDGPGGGFTDSASVATVLADAIAAIPGLDKSQMLLFGGWESATRGAGVVMQMVGEKLGITEQFLAVDELKVDESGALIIKERVEGGRHQVSKCAAPPAVLAWATGNLPEPSNHPQTGMANMRAMMPALQKAKAAALTSSVSYASVALPAVTRQTKIVKDVPAAQIAQELADWIKQ
ncbi:electron transfer flavoprotein subunit beta [uncultured Paludibaculum sp.]|uniref:electron transfer flavoprotein subunit beta n=1 Tax=uncultured Paludibaculum sp. TaxID=1765020 RepID=UPI002AAB7A7C|nr:electron transfer flavoprotein subunit beta [uncultured Paludibaculum sp.]